MCANETFHRHLHYLAYIAYSESKYSVESVSGKYLENGWSYQHRDFSVEFVIEKLTILFFVLDDLLVTFSYDFQEMPYMPTLLRLTEKVYAKIGHKMCLATFSITVLYTIYKYKLVKLVSYTISPMLLVITCERPRSKIPHCFPTVLKCLTASQLRKTVKYEISGNFPLTLAGFSNSYNILICNLFREL